MEAFGEAVANNDEDALKAMLGANFRELIPPVGAETATASSRPGPVACHRGRDGKMARIAVGDDGWTLPIPLVKSAAGWQFDTAAGAEEMRVRRIGRNELAVHADDAGDLRRAASNTPASRATAMACSPTRSELTSSPGKHDGLYWPTKAGEKPSPLGPTFAAAGPPNARPDGYYGYHYKLLTRRAACARRRARLRRARQAARRLRRRGLARPLLGYGRDELHRQPRRTGLRTRPRPRQREEGGGDDSFDPGPGWQKVSP